uniref:2,4-dienoyl-CoA reductase [(3E)-enoyl-CoA-producing] n=2 Tax=Arundo donax TaxID=35708 RepID=A0A0A9ESV3_ARUDO
MIFMYYYYSLVIQDWDDVQAVGFDGDVRKQEDAARVLAATVEHFGKLDILINGAAGNFLASPEDLKPKGFRTVLEIDTVGTYTMCYEAFKYLKKGEQGKGPSTGGLIINISATLQYTAAWYQIHLSGSQLLRQVLIVSQDRWLWNGEQIMTLESTELHQDRFKTLQE